VETLGFENHYTKEIEYDWLRECPEGSLSPHAMAQPHAAAGCAASYNAKLSILPGNLSHPSPSLNREVGLLCLLSFVLTDVCFITFFLDAMILLK